MICRNRIIRRCWAPATPEPDHTSVLDPGHARAGPYVGAGPPATPEPDHTLVRDSRPRPSRIIRWCWTPGHARAGSNVGAGPPATPEPDHTSAGPPATPKPIHTLVLDRGLHPRLSGPNTFVVTSNPQSLTTPGGLSMDNRGCNPRPRPSQIIRRCWAPGHAQAGPYVGAGPGSITGNTISDTHTIRKFFCRRFSGKAGRGRINPR